jgi:hypothetical protein
MYIKRQGKRKYLEELLEDKMQILRKYNEKKSINKLLADTENADQRNAIYCNQFHNSIFNNFFI